MSRRSSQRVQVWLRLTSLPLRSFDMETQHELAFRTLQGGLNTGKVVVRVAARHARLRGGHLVTGGTGGLGLLTGRWLAQQGARRLLLASRSGALASDASTEWEAVQASGATAVVEAATLVSGARSPASCVGTVARWGVACGGGIGRLRAAQTGHLSLTRVYAPKAHGAWCLHAMDCR